MQQKKQRSVLLAAAAALVLGGCSVTNDTPAPGGADSTAVVGGRMDTVAGTKLYDTAVAGRVVDVATGTTAADSSEARAAARNGPPADTSVLRLEVDVSARRLHVFRDDRRIASHAVAVGSAEWPTQRGEWFVRQVIFNPAWIPPRDESWAESREQKDPGAPDNPLGRAQLIYDPPRTIHGTNEPSSIGKAVSHGSIRLPNAVITQLARQIMEESGAGKDEAWYRRARENRTEKQVVDLPQAVPIKVY